MEIRIQKWGNSHAIRLPINFLNNLGIKEPGYAVWPPRVRKNNMIH